MQTLLQTGNTWKARARSHADGLADGADDSFADRRFFRGRFMHVRQHRKSRVPEQDRKTLGKPGYNLALMEAKRFPSGRWALSYWEKPKDRQRKLHPGKCLCSTLGSLAFFFCPANE